MRNLIKIIFFAFLLFTSCKLVYAKTIDESSSTIYKTITNTDLIYVADKDGEFQYSWKFDKNKANFKENMSFALDFNSPYNKKINKIVNNNNLIYRNLHFSYHGSLPSEALMKIKVADKFKDGDSLYLYYYNDKTNELEFVSKNITVKNGMIEFKIEHCSDYLLTGSIVRTALNNPQGLTIIIVILLIVIIGVVATTLFSNRK